LSEHLVLDLSAWARPTDPVDELVLERCTAATLDVGCGPGRMVLELNRRGVPALGIDVAPEAVRQVVAGGGMALHRSVFGRVPGVGRWPNALLLDGCIGIGGAPDRLLRRIRQLLSPGGVVYVEHDPDPQRLDRSIAQVNSRRFDWAVVGWQHLARAASSAGLRVEDSWTAGDRSFVGLRAPKGRPCN
jgi:SAM-dependent methyltransferase